MEKTPQIEVKGKLPSGRRRGWNFFLGTYGGRPFPGKAMESPKDTEDSGLKTRSSAAPEAVVRSLGGQDPKQEPITGTGVNDRKRK